MTMRQFWTQHWPFAPNKYFVENYYHSRLPVSSFHCAKSRKTSSSGSRVMRICNFAAQNDPFPQMKIFFLLIFSEILMIKEYWNLIGRELLLSITWELHFSEACSFPRILMNHKNFHLTQIPDKHNGVIFLKSAETMFLDHFWPFLSYEDSFQKNPAVIYNYIWAPNIMLSFKKK